MSAITSGTCVAGSSPITGAVSGAPVTTATVAGGARAETPYGVALRAATTEFASPRVAGTLAARR